MGASESGANPAGVLNEGIHSDVTDCSIQTGGEKLPEVLHRKTAEAKTKEGDFQFLQKILLKFLRSNEFPSY